MVAITKYDNKILLENFIDGKVSDIRLERMSNRVNVGDIYIGVVKNIVKNINAAFVEIIPGIMGYLAMDRLTEDMIIFTGPRKSAKKCLVIGDEIVVQVKKDAVKLKTPVLTTEIEFNGGYSVLVSGKSSLSKDSSDEASSEKISSDFVSSKIKGKENRETILGIISRVREEKKSLSADERIPGFKVIARTNAITNPGEFEEELKENIETYYQVLGKAFSLKSFSCLKKGRFKFIEFIEGLVGFENETIQTDDEEIFNILCENKLQAELWNESEKGEMKQILRIEKILEDAVNKRVWLKSGGFLVIDYTEAMTVIDVNTGKDLKKGNKEKTIQRVNTEAAIEIARQLRLRNISGIIITDFIDMPSEEDNKRLLSLLKDEIKKDITQCDVIDITKLGLVEMTRKRVGRPLLEEYYDKD